MVQLQMNCVCGPLLSSRFHLGMCALKIISNLIEEIGALEFVNRNFGAVVRRRRRFDQRTCVSVCESVKMHYEIVRIHLCGSVSVT